MEEIRAFIAVELPGPLKLSISRLQERIRSKSGAPLKWVDPQNIHLTLKFLGNISAASTGDIIQAMEGVARGITPVRLNVGELGVFPNRNRTQVIWVGLAGELEKLRSLQRGIDTALAALGFPRETRPFSPHLTIARVRDRATPTDRKDIGGLVAETSYQNGLDFSVSTLHLMKSQLTVKGPIYSRLGSVGLG